MNNKIYFLGSDNFSLYILNALKQSKNLKLIGIGIKKHNINKHKKINPIINWGKLNNTKVDILDSHNCCNEILTKIKLLTPNILLIASFGQILNEDILKLQHIKIVNIHASLLPKYRGPAPITHCILNGDTETGVSFHKINNIIDSGNIYNSYKIQLKGNETQKELKILLGNLAANHTEKILLKIINKQTIPIKQNTNNISYAKKITKNDNKINWNENATLIERKIRAYNPNPKAYCYFKIEKKTIRVQIIKAKIIHQLSNLSYEKNKDILKIDNNNLIILCNNNSALNIRMLIPENKKQMHISNFLCGLQNKKKITIL